jgi:hypothetical protein
LASINTEAWIKGKRDAQSENGRQLQVRAQLSKEPRQ